MPLVIASESQLNAYLDEQARLRDKSAGGLQDAVDQLDQQRRLLTEDTPQSRRLVALGNGDHLTDLSVRGTQRAIDAIEAADPYGLRTVLPAHVEELARMKDVSPSGIKGATALIRVVEKKEPLTDKTVRGHSRAADVTASTPPYAYVLEQKPAAPPASEKSEGLLDKVAKQVAKAVDTVRSWLPF